MKNKNIKITLLVIITIIIGVFFVGWWYIDAWGFKKLHFYTQNANKDECGVITVYHGDNDIITYYPNGKSSKDYETKKKKECRSPGYHIYKNRVNINLGSMTCGHKIKLKELSVDKNMNVYILAGEKKAFQRQCAHVVLVLPYIFTGK